MRSQSNIIERENTAGAFAEHVGFITHSDQILDAIINSNKNNTAIGIRAPGIFNGVLVTGIENIILNFDGDPIIVLKKYDSNGYFLDRDQLKLSEIESVCPFKSSFENPFLKDLGSLSRFYMRTP
jgi:hypothetical protein